MKRIILIAIAVVALTAAAGVALIAQDESSVEKSQVKQEAFSPEGEMFMEFAREFAGNASKQELDEARRGLAKRLAEISARQEAAAKEKEAEKFLEDAEKSLKEAERSLRNVLKMYPKTEAAKLAEGRLIALGKKP